MSNTNKPVSNVLILEDNKELINLLDQFISKKFKTFLCDSIDKAIETMRKNTISVSIIDYHLEGENGMEFIQFLNKEAYKCKKIMLTSLSDLNVFQKLINDGEIDKYVRKPFDYNELMELITIEVRKFQLEKEKFKQLKQIEREAERYRNKIKDTNKVLFDALITDGSNNFTNSILISLLESYFDIISNISDDKMENELHSKFSNIISKISHQIEFLGIEFGLKNIQSLSKIMDLISSSWEGDFYRLQQNYVEIVDLIDNKDALVDLKKVIENNMAELFSNFNKDKLPTLGYIILEKLKNIDIKSLIDKDIVKRRNIPLPNVYAIMIMFRDNPVYSLVLEDNFVIDLHLVSMFFTAMNKFSSEMFSDGIVNIIKHERGIILFEEEKTVLYCLITEFDSPLLRNSLSQFIFESLDYIVEIKEGEIFDDDDKKLKELVTKYFTT